MAAEFDSKRAFDVQTVKIFSEKITKIKIDPFDRIPSVTLPISEIKVVITKEVQWWEKPKFDPVGKTLAFGSRRHKAKRFKMWGIIGTSHGLKKNPNGPEPFNFMLEACKLLANG